jgi:surface carbohydrate biosynthesis protein (TIGR04326 family)
MGRQRDLKIDWINQSDKDDVISLISYVEINGRKIRNIYLTLISSLKEVKVNNNSLNDIYTCLGEYNLFEMSLINEKSFYKTPEINDIIKLIGFRELFKELKPKSVSISNAPAKINEIINEFCLSRKTSFKSINQSSEKSKRKIYKYLPSYFQAFMWILLKYFDFVRCLKIINRANYESSNTVYAIGYFTHINKKMINSGKFYSGMWGSFPDFCYQKNLKIKFLHHFIPNKVTPNQYRGHEQINFLNKHSEHKHSFVSNHSSTRIFIKTLKIFISKAFFSNRIKKSIINKINYESNLNLYSILKESIKSSTSGISLMENIYYCVHFDSLFKKLKHQNLGFYLMENQSWEFALINAWKKNNHGNLIAIQHSTVSFWDLRYHNPFIDRLYSPDKFMVNGLASKEHFIDFNYPTNKVLMIEAIRYMSLNKNLETKEQSINLILGDIITISTQRMLDSIKPISSDSLKSKWVFKPHPANQIKTNKVKDGILSVDDSIYSLFQKTDLIICPSSSGVAIEAYVSGKKVIVFIEPGGINTSPLRGFDNVFFVSDTKGILEALNQDINPVINYNFFNLDKRMKRLNNFFETL